MSRLWDAQRGRCCYCERPLLRDAKQNHPARCTLEHLRRKADGGRDNVDNLALACRECNEGRGSLDWLTYTSLVRGELT